MAILVGLLKIMLSLFCASILGLFCASILGDRFEGDSTFFFFGGVLAMLFIAAEGAILWEDEDLNKK